MRLYFSHMCLPVIPLPRYAASFSSTTPVVPPLSSPLLSYAAIFDGYYNVLNFCR